MSASTVITQGFGTFGTANLVITDGYASGAGEPPAPPVDIQTPAGRKRRQYYAINLKGENHVFTTIDALIAFVSRQEVAVERLARTRAKKDAQRILQVGSRAQAQPPRIAMRSSVPEIRDYISELQRRIDKLYQNALLSELGAQAQEEEDIEIIASLL